MLVLMLGFLIAVADQVVKELVRRHFFVGESVSVISGFFSLTYVRNTGAAWGMFDGSNVALALFSLAVLVLLVVLRRHFIGTSLWQRLALGLMAGGILGNLFDRLRLGYVVDFLHFYRGGYHFPSFNIADAAICTGVFLYLITSFRSESAG
ncbi:MAG: signal peptidase II [Kiritimatiellia bacterium]